MTDVAQLAEQAKAVLRGNWTGAFTKPAPRLYPHLWSWDSAFIAMGYAHYDQVRAEQELRSLFRAQWTNGLLPHIVFNPQATGYFPGPELWRIETSAHAPREHRTSGIVQPPVHATAVLHVFRHAQNRDQAHAFLAEMFPGLRDWHAYLYRERDPHDEGLVYIRHNWESGQDNSPLWDAVWQRLTLRPDQIPPYQRVDTTHVDAADRPTNAEYDRYVYLVKLFADHGYDEACIRPDCPFLIQDVLFNTLLCQSNRDLAEIARLLDEDAVPFQTWPNAPPKRSIVNCGTSSRVSTSITISLLVSKFRCMLPPVSHRCGQVFPIRIKPSACTSISTRPHFARLTRPATRCRATTGRRPATHPTATGAARSGSTSTGCCCMVCGAMVSTSTPPACSRR